MDYVLLISVLILLTSSLVATLRWVHWRDVAGKQNTELERLKNVTKLHCEQIDTLQKEKKGWHNKNKLLNDTNDKLVQRNMELAWENKNLSEKNADLVQRLSTQIDQIVNLRGDIGDLKEELSGVDRYSEQLENDYNDLQSGISTLTAAFGYIDSELKTIASDMIDMGQKVPACISNALEMLEKAYQQAKSSLEPKGAKV